jgi:hypothetical protein
MTVKSLFKGEKFDIGKFRDDNSSVMKQFHAEMQKVREQDRRDVSFKSYLDEVWPGMTPEKFYAEAGIDISQMTVQKMLTTSDLNRYLFPEVFRDAIIRGMEYTPIYSRLITGEETIDGMGVTMPSMDWRILPLGSTPRTTYQMRDTAETATITEADVVVYNEKVVNLVKQARGLKMSYESLMFTPINLATVYFEEMGVVLGADLDRNLINIAINGDQADNSQSSPVIGAATANTLLYTDIARAWIRFKRINRNSSAMLSSEADAITILNMDQFARKYPIPAQALAPTTITVNTPLPSNQDILVHDAVPTGKLVMIDDARAFVQLTAMPLLMETDKIIARQLNETFVSIITGFANIFKDGRLILDYTTNLTTNPGPVVLS